jgi:uncharacterized membrane protein
MAAALPEVSYRKRATMPNVPRHLQDIAPGTSLLPIPFFLSLFACLLFAVTIVVDGKVFRGEFNLPVWLSVGNIDDARALLSALLGAVSTVLALIFSVSLLVFSAAATQFGPRLMHRFLRDRMMQITLGIFIATFFHALFTFIAIRQHGAEQFVPQLTILTTCTLVVISFASLVFFNDKIATSIQANNVLPGILEDLQTAVTQMSHARARQAKRTNGTPQNPDTPQLRDFAELQRLSARDGAVVRSAISGFVQVIHFERLAASETPQADVVVNLLFRPGQFVGQGETIARVLPAQFVKALGPSVIGAVKLGRHRNLEQDAEFAIAQLVEIALRALSPAINDTYTALYCIDWLGEAIRGLANLPEPTGVWSSEDGTVSVLFPPLRFRDIVKTAFDLLRQASIHNTAVKIHLLRTWSRLAPDLTNPIQGTALLEQAQAVWEVTSQETMAAVDRADVKVAYDNVVGLLSPVLKEEKIRGNSKFPTTSCDEAGHA